MRKNGNAGVKRLSSGKFVVDQREVIASTENMSRILMQARGAAVCRAGEDRGVRISEIVPGSIYAKIGLLERRRHPKGQFPRTSPIRPSFFQLYQGLRDERTIAIDLIRGGQRQTLNYEIR